MKTFLRVLLIGWMVTVGTSLAFSQFYVRGGFNEWGLSDVMTDQGGGLYTHQITGLTPGQVYPFKIANEDWSVEWPGSDARVMANAEGEITFRAFDIDDWNDGWLPDSQRRVGYMDSGLHGWEVAGTMNDWDPAGGAFELVDMGDGLYRGEFFLTAGEYEYKFRMAGSWDISIGADFGNTAGNIFLDVPADATYVFELDLTEGRHTAVPEPSTFAVLLGLGALGAVWLRRRRISR